jgi:hypothetical protein
LRYHPSQQVYTVDGIMSACRDMVSEVEFLMRGFREIP